MASTTPRRVNLERGIYRDPSTGRLEITYTDSDGRQRWKTIAGGLREARAARGEVIGKLAKGERVVSSRVTLADYAAEWIGQQETRLRPKTIDRYSTDLRLHVLPRLGKRRIASLDVEDVASLLSELRAKGLAPWSQRGVLGALGRVLGTAARRGLIAENPVAKLERGERPKVQRREFPSLDRADVARLIEVTAARYRALVAVSLLTGLRQGEALGLRWQDVDTREGIVHVRFQLDRGGKLVEPKTGAAKRDVPIPPSLARMLAEARLASPFSAESDFVFASSVGTPLGIRNVVRRGLEPALAKAGLPRFRWHDLRHVAASALIEQGASPSYVARVLGHTSPAITLQVYAHVFAKTEHDERFRELQEAAFADVLSGKPAERSDGEPRRTEAPVEADNPASVREIGTGGD